MCVSTKARRKKCTCGPISCACRSPLTPQQKVELFRIVTGADYKDMMKLGVYAFYRLGIGPDGTWHFFVTGD